MAMFRFFCLALACSSILVAFIGNPVLSCNSCIHRSKLAYSESEKPVKDGACGYSSVGAILIGKDVAAASPKLYRNGVGCNVCYKIRCLDPSLCSKSGQQIVVTDLTTNNETDFVVPMHIFETLALAHKGATLLKKGIVDIEYERIVCEYKGRWMRGGRPWLYDTRPQINQTALHG